MRRQPCRHLRDLIYYVSFSRDKVFGAGRHEISDDYTGMSWRHAAGISAARTFTTHNIKTKQVELIFSR